MSKIATRHILDPETLAEMNAEFRAGLYNQLDCPEIPPLDPASDPFERNFEWLNEPEASSVATAFASLKIMELSDWFAAAGRDLRKVALGGSLAGGTDEQVFERWTMQKFKALCEAAGAEGESLLDAVNAGRVPEVETIERIGRLLSGRAEFASFEPEQLAATALIAFHFLKAPKPS